jgi:cytochrome c-type biogenesis protein CcmI
VVIWIAAILLVIAVALFVAAPLTDHVAIANAMANGAESQRNEHEHALAVQGLRELEFDRAMGKLDANDYRVLRQKLETRALAAMSRQEKTSLELQLERATAVATSSRQGTAYAPLVNFCSQCGMSIGSAHNFCPNCGTALAAMREATRSGRL